MAFRKVKTAAVSLESPEALFRDLRGRSIPALHAHQADILRAYDALPGSESDVALQLPTGSGKTLVGLLLAEWRRRKHGQRSVYLCPTNQLVHQVVEQANTLYGIGALGFVGKKAKYDLSSKSSWTAAESIAVTSYSALFNVNPFFGSPQFLVLDDAHAAENYVASYWSLRLDRFKPEHQPAFQAAIGVLEPTLSPLDASRLRGDWKDRWDSSWVDKISTPVLQDLADSLTAVLDANIGSDSDLRYVWGTLRDHLNGCHVYVGSNGILIRPLIPPSLTHPAFRAASQRLYMSATLGAGGDLERVTGVKRIARLPAPVGWDAQGVGRRLFMFPGWSLKHKQEQELQARLVRRAGRALVLLRDDASAKDEKEWVKATLDVPVFDVREIEESKNEFISADAAVAVAANRYDGIDFPKDQCRLLFVKGLPTATNLQERFLVQKVGATILLNDRILTRVVQAFGRCTRDANDYSAVIVSGEELTTFLLTRERRSMLHPELQAELEFGMEQSKTATVDEFEDYLTQLLGQTAEWREADGQIVAMRESMIRSAMPGETELREAVGAEVDFQYAMWNCDYAGALAAARQVLAHLNATQLRGYRALWLYLAGSAAWRLDQQGTTGMDAVSRDYFEKAKQAAPSLRWLAQLKVPRNTADVAEADEGSSALFALIDRLESKLVELGMQHDRRFAEEEAFILLNLDEQRSDRFEAAHERLGKMLGYESGNRESSGAPDPWWIADDTLCFIFEDHSNADPNSHLHVNKARQAASHPAWVRANLPLNADATVVSVLITPVLKAEPDALPHLSTVSHWEISEFRKWAKTALGAVRALRSTFPGEGDLAWRAQAIEKYRQNGIDPRGLREALSARVAKQVMDRT